MFNASSEHQKSFGILVSGEVIEICHAAQTQIVVEESYQSWIIGEKSPLHSLMFFRPIVADELLHRLLANIADPLARGFSEPGQRNTPPATGYRLSLRAAGATTKLGRGKYFLTACWISLRMSR
jgi:hypothetical protein